MEAEEFGFWEPDRMGNFVATPPGDGETIFKAVPLIYILKKMHCNISTSYFYFHLIIK